MYDLRRGKIKDNILRARPHFTYTLYGHVYTLKFITYIYKC